MDTTDFFGFGKEVTLYMSIRAALIFIIALVLIRLSGRRSFGMRMPFDNVISILLGAILSRAVIGTAPFFPTIMAAVVITVLHRLFAWICLYSHTFGKIIKGSSEVLYQHGNLIRNRMNRYLVSEKDLMEGVRINSNINSLEQVEEVYIERNGEISVVKKEEQKKAIANTL